MISESRKRETGTDGVAEANDGTAVPLSVPGTALVPHRPRTVFLIHALRPPAHLTPRAIRIRLLVISGLALLCVVIGIAATMVEDPVQSAPVTIVLTPLKFSEQRLITLKAVLGPVTQPNVPARMISATSSLSQASGPTTGTLQQPALAAHGAITFFNVAPFSQTVAADLLLTAANGMQFRTLGSTSIPASQDATAGNATVPAVATQAGTQGNIAVGDLDAECCLPGIRAKNMQPFTGGQNAAIQSIVLQHDIDTLAAPFVAQAIQQAQAALPNQEQPGEQLAPGTACAPHVAADHPAGSLADHIAITIMAVCHAEVYNQRVAQHLAGNLMEQQVAHTFGSPYQLTGPLTIELKQIVQQDAHTGTLTLSLLVQGRWVYGLNPQTLRRDLPLIAGKSQQNARAILLRVPGIADVLFTGNAGNTLPDNPQLCKIRIV